MKDVSIPEPKIMAGSESLPQILTLAHTSTQNQNGIIGPGQGQNVNCSETVSAFHKAQITSNSQDKMQSNENENSTGTLDRASSEINSVNHARRWIDADPKSEKNGCHVYLKRLSENSSRLEKSIPNIPGKRKPGFPGPAPIDDFDSDSGPSSESDDKGSEYDPDNDDEYPEGDTVGEDTPDEEKSDADVNEDVDDPSRGKNDAILRNDPPETAPVVPMKVSVHVPRKVIWLNDSDSEDEVYLVPPNSAATVTAASASDMRRDDEESSESDSGSSDVVRLEMPNKRKPDSSSTGDNRDEEDTQKKPRQISECDSTTSTNQNMNVEDQPITLERDIPVVPMDSHRDSITY